MTRELLNILVTSNTASEPVTCAMNGEYFYAAIGELGDFDGGTLKLYLIPRNQTTPVELTDLAYTSDHVVDSLWLNEGDRVYVDMDGSVSPRVRVTLTWGQ